jgi:hypothetical protein
LPTPVLASLIPAAVPLAFSVLQSVKLGRAHQTVSQVTQQLQEHKAALEALTKPEEKNAAATLAARFLSRPLHEDVVHRPRRGEEEVARSLPPQVPPDQPQVCLVHQRRRLEAVPGRKSPQLLPGEPTQFLVYQRQQILGVATPARDLRRQLGQRIATLGGHGGTGLNRDGLRVVSAMHRHSLRAPGPVC